MYGPDRGKVAGCVSGNSVAPSRVTLPGGETPAVAGPALAATGGNPILPVLAVLLTLTALAARRRTLRRP